MKNENAKKILVITRADVASEMEEEYNRWYNEEHLPSLLKVRGVLSGTRGVNTGNGQKYIAVYVHENAEVQKSAAYKKAVETEWTQKIRPYIKNFTRENYEIL